MPSEPPPGAPRSTDVDELLRPTIADDHPSTRPERRPWRLGSQVYVAFFGGAAGAAIVAFANAGRLGLKRSERLIIVALGAAGVLVAAAIAALVLDGGGADADRNARLLAQVVGVAAWGGMYLVQRTADRIYSYHREGSDDYSSLWGFGLAAAVAGGLLQALVIVSVAGAM